MKILVSNIGSTSFKFRLFDIGDGRELELASGGVDRIGGAGGVMTLSSSTGAPSVTADGTGETAPRSVPSGVRRVGGTPMPRQSRPCACADHGAAIKACLEALVETGALAGVKDVGAVAFKAVMAGDCEPTVFVDEKVLKAMEYYAPVAPAHNPAYVAAMRSFAAALPGVPLVAAFEPGFHRTIPTRRRSYAIPDGWEEKYGIRRYGYHGASHRYIAQRTAELMGPAAARRIISCHLGGSSSLCAIRNGASVATSMGFSPQTGLPQSRRVGEFDCYALAIVARESGKTLEALLKELGDSAGLAAMSATSGDMRDIRAAAEGGSAKAGLALEAFVTAVRDYLGAYLVELGGADAIVFTGGIGQNNPALRAEICRGLDFAGIALDARRNAAAAGECRFDLPGSSAALWVMPTNEELVVARQAAKLMTNAE